MENTEDFKITVVQIFKCLKIIDIFFRLLIDVFDSFNLS
jgi:hypothetical protein